MGALYSLFSQTNDFTDGTSMKAALEALSNIDSVTVTLDPVFTFDVAGSGENTLELQYKITFTGDCVRGDIPDAALESSSCGLSSTTTEVASITCR